MGTSFNGGMNENGKRPAPGSAAAIAAAAKAMAGLPNTKTLSEVGPKDGSPLRRNAALGKYFDYDLSKMVDSRGGFLVEDDHGPGQRLEPRKILQDPAISLDMSRNPKCSMCGSIELDVQFQTIFGVNVCFKCKDKYPDKFSLLTKTECKEDYLLTDPELRDTEVLPHWLKPNPHKATWNNMMLYLRSQVEEFAFKKWGGEEGLDKEYARRIAEKKVKKNKKFEEKLKDLRKKTRTSGWQKRKEAEHQHAFGETVTNAQTGTKAQACEICGMEIEVDEF